MTTETIQPPVEVGPAPDNGQGQSQGHRRRRRRRKNKSSQQSAAPQAQAQVQQAPAPVQQQAQPPKPPAHKKKKKFQPKAAAPQAQPGNSFAQPPKRKMRQKGPREFVGPMDHSYRVVNGNVADGPPSTIQMNSSRMTHWEDPYVAPAAVREDAPVRIYCFIEDLFFLAKIQETARKLGVKVEFVKGSDKEVVARLLDLPESERPALVVFDLNNVSAKPITLIPKFKSKYKKTVSVIGFLSHLQGELKMKASEVGCDTVMPRSAFSQSLPNLLRRYGVEEEEEDNTPQPD
ncbi:MAG: response regulator [Terracidiphilus sp.]|nr:response regulator [Terracidiphilus sp.]